jgi:hypothetical protein
VTARWHAGRHLSLLRNQGSAEGPGGVPLRSLARDAGPPGSGHLRTFGYPEGRTGVKDAGREGGGGLLEKDGI